MVDTDDVTKGGFRRVEVLVGTKRRRDWSAEAKGRIVAESLLAGAVVSQIARRHGLRPQQVFAWRHEAKEGRLVLPGEDAMSFVPVSVVESGLKTTPQQGGASPEVIEIELAGAVVRARTGMDLNFLSSVLRAIRISA